jgi:hypothetical protein
MCGGHAEHLTLVLRWSKDPCGLGNVISVWQVAIDEKARRQGQSWL